MNTVTIISIIINLLLGSLNIGIYFSSGGGWWNIFAGVFCFSAAIFIGAAS